MTSLLARRNTKSGATMVPVRRSGPRGATSQDAATGLRVRAMRQERKLSQTTLGEYLGVTFQQVQKYEKGKNRLCTARLMRLAEVFGCPIATILGTSEQQLEQSLGDKMTATRRGALHAATFIRLKPDAQDHLVNLAEWLLQMQERGK